jgi:hypothetical protein
MASDLAIAAISSGSALLGGVIGGGVSHITTIRSHKHQTEQEHFQRRQDAYMDFMDAAHAFVRAAGALTQPTPDGWVKLLTDFEHALTGVQLFGSDEARASARHMEQTVAEMMVTGEAGKGEARYDPEVFKSSKHDIFAAWDAAIEAMRADVGPDA